MKNYFYSVDNQKHGPLSFEELKQENITKDFLIWFEGLEDWTFAGDLEEMRPILELKPPPVETVGKESDVEIEEKNKNHQKPDNADLKVASKFWITTGFIFSLLGGIIGIAVGLNYAFGDYKKGTKRLGWIMFIIGAYSFQMWRNW